MRPSHATARLLRRIADAVESLSDADVAAIIESGVELTPSRGMPPARRGRTGTRLSDDELTRLRADLEALPSREAGVALLEERCANREQLEQLIRSWDLPYRKGETRSEMMDNLVEAAIGYRLRSQAIQSPSRDGKEGGS